jgi:signal transduction histidine kinase
LLKAHQIQVGQAKEMEQNRISRELHDGVMNKLYGVRLKLGILNNSDEEAIKEKRLDCIDVLQEIESEIRAISHDLHSEVFDLHFEYIMFISNLVNQQNELSLTHFMFTCDTSINWENVTGLVKISIYRIIQEAVLNVNKYAEATACTVSLTLSKQNQIQLVIEDNGKGFDIAKNKHQGIGLKNIKERVTLLKAALTIESKLGNGTKIVVLLEI